jgi:hypothetical protein
VHCKRRANARLPGLFDLPEFRAMRVINRRAYRRQLVKK